MDGRSAGINADGIQRAQISQHGDSRANGPVRVVLPRKRHAKQRHQRIADKLVEDASFADYAIHHHGEILIEHRHGFLGAERFRKAGEGADIGEQYGGFLAHAPESVLAALQQLFRNLFGHIARHCALNAFLGGDVLKHQHCPQPLPFTALERHGIQVQRNLVALPENNLGVDGDIHYIAGADLDDLFLDPSILAGEISIRQLTEHIVGLGLKNPKE